MTLILGGQIRLHSVLEHVQESDKRKGNKKGKRQKMKEPTTHISEIRDGGPPGFDYLREDEITLLFLFAQFKAP